MAFSAGVIFINSVIDFSSWFPKSTNLTTTFHGPVQHLILTEHGDTHSAHLYMVFLQPLLLPYQHVHHRVQLPLHLSWNDPHLPDTVKMSKNSRSPHPYRKTKPVSMQGLNIPQYFPPS